MDVFVEQMIRRKLGIKDFLIFIGIIIAGIILILACAMFVPPLLLLAFILICAGAYYLFTMRNLEFEYSVTNGDFTIDKIINRSRRKRVVALDLKEVEEFGKYKPDLLKHKDFQTRIFASVTDNGTDNAWYLTVRHAKYGNLLLVFSPNDRVLSAVKPFLKRQVSVNAFGRN